MAVLLPCDRPLLPVQGRSTLPRTCCLLRKCCCSFSALVLCWSHQTESLQKSGNPCLFVVHTSHVSVQTTPESTDSSSSVPLFWFPLLCCQPFSLARVSVQWSLLSSLPALSNFSWLLSRTSSWVPFPACLESAHPPGSSMKLFLSSWHVTLFPKSNAACCFMSYSWSLV